MADKTLKTGMCIIDGTEVIDPSELSCTFSDISAPDAGRDEAMRMHKGLWGTIRQYAIAWNGISDDDARVILRLVNGKNEFPCRLTDPETGETYSGEFYTGDRTMPIKQWRDGKDGKVYSKLSFTLIEVMPDSGRGL